ncbi:DEAD/DEAH box helicase family protein [Sinorhizobium meliloti]|uniref:DEAD/DEAH box helicase family protein n=1 Tax=Rhizobium meliloti TaxID=382 RepID=UPI0001E4C416|nr:DEAD/DEAH box helicase family protein [Sinorhizobium meliloti]AEG04140.1 helicase domain protein [Sinorhizobium meliloti BL225C]MDE4545084.1 helicase [Sinorhizobium meliloti]MDE4573894.1 helicase [Sinorhizobium meliloti]SDX91043.1 Helicase conserved C-terminal domain-containing protein [Sinorhizobium meliloti]
MMMAKTPAELGRIDVELKEAVCDALVNMITRRASGTDEAGRSVYGKTPRRSVFSGQLLPRMSTDNEDETSDIKIAAIGMDFNIDAESSSQINVAPRFSVYVRILPTWEEISTERFGIAIDFKLRKDKKQEIDHEIHERREELYAKEKLDRPDWNELTQEERDALHARRREIRDNLRSSVYAKHGVILGKTGLESFDEAKQTDETEDPIPTDGSEDPDAAPSPLIGRLVTSGAQIPTALLSPASIPPKWRRLDLALPVLAWSAALSGTALKKQFEDFSKDMAATIAVQLSQWLQGEGDKIAWRDRSVTPADATSEANWNAFVADLIKTPADPKILPDLRAVALRAERQRDFIDRSRASIRITLDNGCTELSKIEARYKCNAIFGTGVSVQMPETDHRPVQLDRVEPSYRFRDFMSYPAIGLNCGVDSQDLEGGLLELATTWSPRFNQPRIVPRRIDGVEYRFRPLADGYDVSNLLVLVDEYRKWIDQEERALAPVIARGLSPDDGQRERERFATDLAGQRVEATHIDQGIRLLISSRDAALEAARSSGAQAEHLRRKAAPWQAWLMMNESFARRDRKDPERGWRLFQLAFILAHVPTFASRMEEYTDFLDVERDELSASLLYFPTGGGKSEAFYGALVFAIFLDRLRGKDRGITAMIRYPLRLLTLQQAQRLLRLIVWTEVVRKENNIGSWPIEIGFWVGSSNTPNRFSYMKAALHDLADYPTDVELGYGRGQEAKRYQEAQASYNKVPSCPCCQEPTGLRKHKTAGGKAEYAAIVCFNPKCEWNKVHGHTAPLPFLLTDDTIYQRAPAIVLGTVDKLAMLGQSTSTITDILGMFGLARWIGPDGHMSNPSKREDLQSGPAAVGATGVVPAYANGRKVFLDPFPSLIIQDEAHLLEESLGTFSGLFDTLLENTFMKIDKMAGDALSVSRYKDLTGKFTPRLPKIIAATATISDPERQLKTLYQRKPLRYPYPGPDIYRSFFAEPEAAPSVNNARVALSKQLPSHLAPEATAPWMRLYVSLMTNDATHTVTTVGVLSSFHAVITHLWNDLLDSAKSQAAIAELAASVSPGSLGDWRRKAIERASTEGRADEIMALVDLHRIALAYVTNKKGGDQIIDALHSAVVQKLQMAGMLQTKFLSRLISGGIDMQEIQGVMKEAETSFVQTGYAQVGETLRNIVATSAISHGVDVDRFNSMFFAGLPSDIAEYIQASSRVGRTHVGFVMLLPTPQSRRDRYVIETHDIFHRFLERMIAPPAVERWSEAAIDRVRASYFQTWAMLNDARNFLGLPDSRKSEFVTQDSTTILSRIAGRDPLAFANDIGSFMLASMGFAGKGPDALGEPVAGDYYRTRTDAASQSLSRSMRDLNYEARLRRYWEEQDSTLKKPMTSLRDVDEAGLIVAADFDRSASGSTRIMDAADIAAVMKAIRRQRGDAAETDGEIDWALED